MKLHTRRGFGNVLLRKVMQHSTFATLFSTAPTQLIKPVSERVRTPTPLPGKTIVQATLAKSDIFNSDNTMPIAPAWPEYLPGRPIPRPPSHPEQAPGFKMVDNTTVQSVQPAIPAEKSADTPNLGKSKGEEKSIWRQLTAPFRPHAEIAKDVPVKKLQSSPVPAAAPFRSPAVQSQRTEPSPSPILTQLPQPPKGEMSLPAPASPPKQSGLSGDDWRVLQSIHRKHQERAAQEATEAVNGEVTQPSLSQKSIEIPENAPGQPEMTSRQVEGSPVQKASIAQETGPIHGESQAKSANPIFHGLRNIFRKKSSRSKQPSPLQIDRETDTNEPIDLRSSSTKADADTDIQMSPAKETPPSRTYLASDQGLPISPTPAPIDRLVSMEKTPAMPPRSKERVIERMPSIEGQKSVAKPSSSFTAGGKDLHGEISKLEIPQSPENDLTFQRVENKDSEERATPQPLPLEEIWPVEEVPRQTAITSEQQAEGNLQNPIASPPGNSTGQVIQRKLEQVSTGEPTRSSVEVIAPRRPRPAPIATETPAPIQRKPAPGEMVHTDIGELPADLWHLIGETPPQQNFPGREDVTGPSQPETSSKMPGKVSPLQKSTSTDLPTAPPEKAAAQVSAPEISERKIRPPVHSTSSSYTIQREESPPEGETSAPKSVETDKNIKSGSEDINIEALASQVYREVKRRMTFEWERTRRY